MRVSVRHGCKRAALPNNYFHLDVNRFSKIYRMRGKLLWSLLSPHPALQVPQRSYPFKTAGIFRRVLLDSFSRLAVKATVGTQRRGFWGHVACEERGRCGSAFDSNYIHPFDNVTRGRPRQKHLRYEFDHMVELEEPSQTRLELKSAEYLIQSVSTTDQSTAEERLIRPFSNLGFYCLRLLNGESGNHPSVTALGDGNSSLCARQVLLHQSIRHHRLSGPIAPSILLCDLVYFCLFGWSAVAVAPAVGVESQEATRSTSFSARRTPSATNHSRHKYSRSFIRVGRL
jgi:hypothetical protein